MDLKKLFIINVLVLGLCSVAHAEKIGDGHVVKQMWQNREGRLQKIFDELGVSDEQRAQLKANKEKNREAMKAVHEQKKSLREELNQELMKPELDMAKVKEIHEKMKALDAQVSDNRLDSILEVRKILTPEQFGKFLSVMKEKMNKFHEGKEKDEAEHSEQK